MKKSLLFIFCGLFIWTNLQAQQSKSMTDSLSYSVGVMIAQGLKSQGLKNLTTTDLAKGINDVLDGNDLAINENDAMQIFQTHLQAQKAKEFEGQIGEGQNFLDANAKREGVVTLESGLQYEVMNEGEGTPPKATDKVTVHYHGTLIDGTVFDSSVERGSPATFPVNGVIKGWVEALQLMKPGDKWKLFIPYDLAYGERAAGPKIKPYSTLIFEVELLSIN